MPRYKLIETLPEWLDFVQDAIDRYAGTRRSLEALTEAELDLTVPIRLLGLVEENNPDGSFILNAARGAFESGVLDAEVALLSALTEIVLLKGSYTFYGRKLTDPHYRWRHRLRRIACGGVGWGPREGPIECCWAGPKGWQIGNGTIVTIETLPIERPTSPAGVVQVLDQIETALFGRTFSPEEEYLYDGLPPAWDTTPQPPSGAAVES